MMNPKQKRVMWVVSGPSCVGKSFFLENKRRVSGITGLPLSKWKEYYGNHQKKIEEEVKLKDTSFYVHLEITNRDKWHHNWRKICNLTIKKKAIILGTPFSIFQNRVKKRGEDNYKRIIAHGSVFTDGVEQMIESYQKWVEELEKNEILYLFVESIDDFKILRKEDFFKMLCS